MILKAQWGGLKDYAYKKTLQWLYEKNTYIIRYL